MAFFAASEASVCYTGTLRQGKNLAWQSSLFTSKELAMRLSQSFQIDDLHYQVTLQQQELEFFLQNPPRRLLPRRADAWLMFWDEDQYENLAINAPVFQVMHHVSAIVLAWCQRHNVRYFEFSTDARKANVYERYLQRKLPKNYAYQRCVNTFYVYVTVD